MITRQEIEESWRVAHAMVEEIVPNVETKYTGMFRERFPHLTDSQVAFALSFLWWKLGLTMYGAANQLTPPAFEEMKQRVESVMNEYMIARID